MKRIYIGYTGIYRDYRIESFDTTEEAVVRYLEVKEEVLQLAKKNYAFDQLTVEETQQSFDISFYGVGSLYSLHIESDDVCDYHFFDVTGEFDTKEERK